MAVEAEALPVKEEYAESLYDLRQWGALACQQSATVEYQNQKELVFDNFMYAVAEMAATDKDYREVLDVDPRKSHRIVDGKACASNGESMVAITARGEAKARFVAASNEAMEFQVVRDVGDRINAERVDELPVGWTRLVPSMDPKEALRDHRDQAEKLGYKDGLMYWQRYTHSDEKTLDTGSHSVDMSDLSLWRDVIRDFFDMEIPQNVSADEWIRHGIEIECTAEEAEIIVRDMRREYYKRVGAGGQRHSVSEYLEQHSHVAEEIFNAYYPALADAVDNGKNNSIMSGLAGQILQTDAIYDLEPEVRRQLVTITNSQDFDSEAGRTMNSIIRYMTVEELRKGLPRFISGVAEYWQPTGLEEIVDETGEIPPEALNQLMVTNLQCGVKAGRSYGGCAGQVKLSIGPEDEPDNPQDTYGGKDCPEVKNGQRVKCPHCQKEVNAIVPDRKTIYCSNKNCKMAAPDLDDKEQV